MNVRYLTYNLSYSSNLSKMYKYQSKLYKLQSAIGEDGASHTKQKRGRGGSRPLQHILTANNGIPIGSSPHPAFYTLKQEVACDFSQKIFTTSALVSDPPMAQPWSPTQLAPPPLP